MSYTVDANAMGLEQLRQRLEGTDLIPSHQALLESLPKRLASLKGAGIKTVSALRERLKSAKSLAALAEDSGIDPEYLKLLRRVIEGFFPKPQPLRGFAWLDPRVIAKLGEIGITDSRQLYEAAAAGLTALAKKSGLSKQALSECVALSDLSRVQWVSPTFARVLVAAGFVSAAEVAEADPDALYSAVTTANSGALYYKGKIGLRDIQRLIAAASHVPAEPT